MELRTPLENNEWNWNVEKMEMLERFDSERKEWECQWKMMQKKIEELYQEVRLRREKNLNGAEDKLEEKMLQFSMPFSQDEPFRTTNLATQNHVGSIKPDKGDKIWLNDYSHTKTELKKPNHNQHVCSVESEKSIAQKMSKMENDTLNDALKEIARVSEELCKYQDEIRTRTVCKKYQEQLQVRKDFHVLLGHQINVHLLDGLQQNLPQCLQWLGEPLTSIYRMLLTDHIINYAVASIVYS